MALSTISFTYVLYGGVTLIVARVLYEFFLSPLKHIPGPFLAKFTDFYRAGLTTRGHVDSTTRGWHKKWGSAVRVGPNAISISDPDLIRVIYTTKNPWRKSNMYRPNDVVINGQRIQNIFNTADKNFHAKYTKPIGGFWTLTKILDLEPVMDETLSELVGHLDRRFANTGDVCKMDDWVAYYAWDAAANISFGRHYSFMEEGGDVGGIIAESTAGLKYFAPVSQIPWLDEWLDKNPVWRIGPRPLVNGFVYTVKILTEYQQQVASGAAKRKPVDLFIDKYNSLKDTHDFVDDNQVINWLMLNVLAGGDSTAGAMRSVAYHVVKDPAVYKKLIAEIESANLSLPVPQWKEISKLTYFDAVMRESMRIAPAVGLMLEREVPEGGFELPDGRFIPANTKVGINPCVVTRDAGVFGDDVDTFRPERWLRRDDETEDEYTQRFRRMHECTELMFGHGTRVCMGKHMAKIEMYKLFATVYANYDVKLTSPDHEWKYHNSWFMYHSDIPCILTPRQRT
ncbi:hypothetical protein NCS57_00320500 [Fusarium keratoplasticum]|uniref:Uncharacterized protein n=1 Tax=Fusarium keratoplasticum TaxID=1328300 RepID=A0ACC0RCC2_9HYPO|nr:hypothetical protein NCS57_00320500 [Fusarium keratoplasticum]KAI8680400.1 hypothetical protein NCS57_00320500 [Fusarium keratoplasticum]KAI8686464.1 hypothetical protein NCS55_00322200 [Fusarium keratoplasticum]